MNKDLLHRFRRIQEKELHKLIKKAAQTDFGKSHDFDEIHSYSDFVKRVPLTDYEQIKSEIDRMKRGEENVLWKGITSLYAISSGTTGKGKHLPISEERLISDKKFRLQIIRRILFSPQLWPVFKGKWLSLPGKLDTEFVGNRTCQVGEISAITATRIPTWVEKLQIIPVKESILLNWDKRFELLLQKSLQSDVRGIIGAPTWIAELLQLAKQRSGKELSNLWPNLKIIISGGVAFAHYEESINHVLNGMNVSILEMYGASEGYFGLSDLNKTGYFEIMIQQGMFFEFEDVNSGGVVPIWQIQENVEYDLRVSNNSGLWRFQTKDKVVFNEKGFVSITGRTGVMSDYYGEAIEANEIKQILKQLDITYKTLTFGPLETDSQKQIGLILTDCSSVDINSLEKEIDLKLVEQNRHYSIRRETGVLSQIKVKICSFQSMNSKVLTLKQGSQTKIPVCVIKIEMMRYFFND